jgi:2-polyprenyl-3-methyl-5-hydroxy-6-metoxy-1,4-benzoquinol methylase
MKPGDFIEERYAASVPGDIERVNKIVELSGKGDKMLDIGCGVGLIGELVIKKGNTVYGLDLSKGAVKNAVKRGLKARTFDIRKPLPYKNNFFDGIIMGEIIEHVVDTDDFLQKAKRILRKDGYIIITTPNIASFGRRLMLLFGINPHIEYYLRADSAGHVRYFTRDTLVKLLGENGFKVEVLTSDEINFNVSGTIKTKLLARLFPTIGRTLIVKARKVQ